MSQNGTEAKIRHIVEALKAYEPEKIIVFGSAARGDTDSFSDLDIVVIKETNDRFLDRLGTVYELIQPDFALDVLVYTSIEFAQMQAERNSFVEEVLREGMVVYEREKGELQEPISAPQGDTGMRQAQAEQEGRRWLEQAQADMAVARWTEQGGYHSAACFWAQQTGERALKAYLYFRGKRRVFGHSVLELAKDCADLDADFAPIVTEVALLDRYYIPTRYPNGLPGGVPAQVYREDEANEALRLADRTLALVAGKILHQP